MNNYETALQTAKAGIWYRAQRTANPKGTILKLQKMNGMTTQVRAYNAAVDAAKEWARATPKPAPVVQETYTMANTKLQLRVAAKKAGLPIRGTKQELLDRLAA